MISFQLYMYSSRYAPQILQRAVNVKEGSWIHIIEHARARKGCRP